MHEIIHVVDADTSSGTFRHGLEIEAVSHHPLAAGYYFVLWPATGKASRQRGKRYFGPFQTRAEARLLLTSALSLGLAESGQISQTVVECRSTVRRPHAAANDGCGAPAPPAWRDAATCAA